MLIFIINLLFNAAIVQWWGGHSFGMRRLINCSSIFAFGIAAFINSLHERKIIKLVIILLFIFLSIVNILMIKAYILQIIPHEELINFFELINKAFHLILDYSTKQIISFFIITIIGVRSLIFNLAYVNKNDSSIQIIGYSKPGSLPCTKIYEKINTS